MGYRKGVGMERACQSVHGARVGTLRLFWKVGGAGGQGGQALSEGYSAPLGYDPTSSRRSDW